MTGPLWAATCQDADRFLAEQRRLGRSVSTRAGKAGTLASFYEFMISRYQGRIHRVAGVLVEQPIDEFNRQSGAAAGHHQSAAVGCRDRIVLYLLAALDPAGPQVSARRAGLLRCLAVASAGVAD